jgi:hypothetical protein
MHQSLLDHLHLPKRPTRALAALLLQYRTEVDSHADTCAFGNQAYMVQDTGAHVNVDGFVSSIGTVQHVAICTMAVAYDCPTNLQTYILFFPQALYTKGMSTNLLSPFQLRDNRVTVNDTPLQHLPADLQDPMQHSIQMGDLHIPLDQNATTSGFLSCKPTELDVRANSGSNGMHVYMTSDASWDPHSPLHQDIESTL